MLQANSQNQTNDLIYMEFQDVSKEMIPWISEIADEYHCMIEKKEWKSKYNHYVVYDYEPFCSDGFEINLTVSGKNLCFLNFVRYLYEAKMQTIKHLNNCIQL